MISRALAARLAEQIVKVLLIVAIVALIGGSVIRQLLIALGLICLISIVGALTAGNPDSPYLLPASVDEPLPAPIDRIDATLIPVPVPSGRAPNG